MYYYHNSICKKMKKKFLYLTVISMFFAYGNNIAQGTWEVFTKDDGLKSNNIGEIFKDSKGNLWFNPPVDAMKGKGIMKFDGKDWINYYDINLKLVTVFFEDSKGTVWLSAGLEDILSVGLWKINGSSFERISKVGTRFIVEGSDGKIWFGGKKLGSYDGNTVIEYSKKELGENIITALHCDNSGNIWAGTKNGLAMYDGERWKIFSNISIYSTEWVNAIISDANGNIWFGAENGVYKYDGTDWKHFTVKDGLSGDKTWYIRIDSHNNIYAIKYNKLAVFNFNRNPHTVQLANGFLSIFKNGQWRAFSDGEDVPANLGLRFFEDKSGNLWFNSFDKTIYKFDGKIWTSFNESNGWKLKEIQAILEDSKGNYWFGSTNGIGKFDGNKWSYFNKDTGLPSNLITSIIEDKEGNIWFATFRGVVKYTPE